MLLTQEAWWFSQHNSIWLVGSKKILTSGILSELSAVCVSAYQQPGHCGTALLLTYTCARLHEGNNSWSLYGVVPSSSTLMPKD